MKKNTIILLTVLVIIMLSASIVFSGCTKAAAETTVAAAETTVAAEESTNSTIKNNLWSVGEVKTRGPNGEVPIWTTEITLTADEKAQVIAGKYKVGLANLNMEGAQQARIKGSEAAAKELGMTIVASTDANMDPAKQKSDIESILNLDPDIICSYAIETNIGAATFDPAVAKGVKLAFMTNIPDGYTLGKEYCGMVTDDLVGMGEGAADMLAEALGGKGEIAWIFQSTSSFCVNTWDNSFKQRIKDKYPDIKIVAEQGYEDVKDCEGIASAIITQHPNIAGIYSSWDAAGEYTVSACRAAKRPDIKVVVCDLGATDALDLAQGGNIVGASMDLSYAIGYTQIYLGAWGMLGKVPKSFCIVPSMKVTRATLKDMYYESMHTPLPDAILKALEK